MAVSLKQGCIPTQSHPKGAVGAFVHSLQVGAGETGVLTPHTMGLAPLGLAVTSAAQRALPWRAGPMRPPLSTGRLAVRLAKVDA